MGSKFLTLDQVMTELSNGFSRNLTNPNSAALQAVSMEASRLDLETVRLTLIKLREYCSNCKDILMEIPAEMEDDINLVSYAAFLQSTVNDIVKHYYLNDMDPLNSARVIVDCIRAYCEFICSMEKLINRGTKIIQSNLSEKFKKGNNNVQQTT